MSMRTVGSGCETTGKWFNLDRGCHQATVVTSNGLGSVPSYHPSSTAKTRLVQVERTGRDCCGCCGCFANCCARGNDGWRGLDGRWRERGLGATGVIGGMVFVIALVSMMLLTLLVWSLDSFGDAVGDVYEDRGSGSGM